MLTSVLSDMCWVNSVAATHTVQNVSQYQRYFIVLKAIQKKKIVIKFPPKLDTWPSGTQLEIVERTLVSGALIFFSYI